MNYYEILGVSQNATTEQIISAFRKLAKDFHPDRNKSPDASKRFIEIYEAYKVLSDYNKRKIYDQTIFTNNAESSNKDYDDFVNNAKQEGTTLSKQKYRKAMYKILSSIKKNFIETIGFIFYTLFYLIIEVLLKYVPILLILLIIYGIAMCSIKTKNKNIQNEHQEQYSDLFNNLDSYNQSFPVSLEDFSLKNKKILIIENQKISNTFYKLSGIYRPNTDSEIDYILKCESTLVKVGKYSDGAIGYRKDYTIHVIDYKQQKEIGSFEAIGNEPPSTKKNSGDKTGLDTLLSTINSKLEGN